VLQNLGPGRQLPMGFGTQAFTKDHLFRQRIRLAKLSRSLQSRSSLVTMILQICDKSPPSAGVYLSLLQERFCYRIFYGDGNSPFLRARKRMFVARIICTNFEDALQLAVPLSERFDEVQIAEPGCACGEADLEINLECCSLDEAMASISLLIGPGANENTARQRPAWKTTEKAAGAWLASDQAYCFQAGLIGDRLGDKSAQGAEQSGNGVSASADRSQPLGMLSTGSTSASLIKKPRQGNGLVGWLHRLCPISRSQIHQ